MKINEIKKTVTEERVIMTEYIAEDGTIFDNSEECVKYEKSALYAVSKQLKRINKRNITQYDFMPEASDDCEVEIFDIQTEDDLRLLRQYLKLKNYGSRKDVLDEEVTCGHEILIFWNYDKDYSWTYGDGSFNGLLEYIRRNYTKALERSNKEE